MKKTLYIMMLGVIMILSMMMASTPAKAQAIETIETMMLCQGDSLVLQDGRVFKQKAVVAEHYIASDGVTDSIHKIILNFAPSYLFEQVRSLSLGDSFNWHGQTITSAGVYYDKQHTTIGCDSIYRLSVTQAAHDCQTVITEKEISLCPEEEYHFGKHIITTDGVYADTLRNHWGCDSIVLLTVHYIHPTTISAVKRFDGTSYTWRRHMRDDKVLTAEGVYYDTIISQRGCDSVYYRLELYKDEPVRKVLKVSICEDETPYEWNGSLLYTTDSRIKVDKAADGRDSITELQLTVQPNEHTTSYYKICSGTTLQIGNLNISEAGVYHDTLQSGNICHQIATYIVTNARSFYQEESITIGAGQTINWHNQTITAAGRYEDRNLSASNCDSIYVLNVIMRQEYPSYFVTEQVRICEDLLPYVWNGTAYSSTGTYQINKQTVNGMDSIVELQLTVLKRQYKDILFTLCANESQIYHGKTYSDAGVFYDTIPSSEGCDSVLRITVQKLAIDTVHTYVEIADNQTYRWDVNGTTYDGSQAGVYFEHFTNQHGCDSVQALHLTVWPTYHMDTTATVCRNDLPYRWHGVNYSEAGTYIDRHETIHGYDSIYTLHLTVTEGKHEFQYATICEQGSYHWRGRTLTEAGTYNDTLVSDAGCDSIITLVLNIQDAYIFEEVVDMSDQEMFRWRINGETYTEPGTYYAHYFTKEGSCDSTYMLTLNVWPTYYMDTVAEICQTELPFVWRGQEFNASGEYKNRFATVHGYDSIYTLHLTVHEVVIEEVNLNLCKGDSVRFNGKTYTKGGIYQDADDCTRAYRIIITEYIPKEVYTKAVLHNGETYYWLYDETLPVRPISTPGVYKELVEIKDAEGNGTGCYNIYHLELTTGTSYLFEETATICEGDAFVWRGRDLSTSHVGTTTVYWDSLQTREGRDSVYKLTLTVGKEYLVMEHLTLCAGGSITWNGITYTESGVYEHTLHTALGCDSIVRTIVNVAPTYYTEDTTTLVAGETFDWYGQTISKDGDYFQYLKTVDGCDSTVVLHVGIVPAKPQSFLMTERVAICESEAPYTWRGVDYPSSGIYYDSLRTKDNERDSVYMLNLTIYPSYRQEKNLIQHLYTCQEHSTISYHGHSWNQDDYAAAGNVHDEWVTLSTVHGCDSMVHVFLHFNQHYENVDERTITNQEVPYTWQGRELTTSGEYTAIYTDRNGCDSTYTLKLTVVDKFINEESQEYCWNEYPEAGIDWHGLNIPRIEGTKTYSTGTGDTSADPQYILHITIWPKYESVYNIDICEGQTVQAFGQTFSEAGDIDINLHTIHGCDSIIHVHVNAYPAENIFKTDYIDMYHKKTYPWDGADLTKPGVYTKHTTTENGCDQILQLTLKELPVNMDSIIVCPSDTPYIWREHAYTHTGVWEEMDKDENNRDTMLHVLKLEVKPAYELRQQINICEGGTVTFQGKVYDGTVGLDTVRLKTIDNCDSIIIVTINQFHAYHQTEHKYLRPGDIIEWMGQTIDQPGRYVDHSQTENGCDDIKELFVDPLMFDTTVVTLCQGETYEWLGSEYSMTGIYAKAEKDHLGADSAEHVLMLTVYPTYEEYRNLHFCKGESVMFDGQSYDKDITFTVNKLSIHGCDSIIHVTISEHEPFTSEETIYWRAGREAFEWHGKIVDGSESYMESRHTDIYGCDSTYILYVLPLNVQETRDGICEENLPYVWQGIKFWQSTYDYTIRIPDVNGRDSAELILQLDVIPTRTDTIEKNICQGETLTIYNMQFTGETNTDFLYSDGQFCPLHVHVVLHEIVPITYIDTLYLRDGETTTWRGQTITVNNEYKTYEDIVKSVDGCDSVYYYIDVRKLDSIPHDYVICASELPFIWHEEPADADDTRYYGDDNTYTGSDTISYILKDQSGRDSVIHTLNLKVNPVYDTIINQAICSKDLPYVLPIMGQPKSFWETGVYTYTVPSEVTGCDSTFHLYLTVYKNDTIFTVDTICETQLPYRIGDEEYWNEGYYSYNKPGHYPNGVLCDSIVDLRLVIRPTMTKNDSVIMCKEDLPFILGDKNLMQQWPEYKGLPFYTDTVVWDCDHTHYFHVIVRDPIPMDDIYFCDGDSVQFGFHNDGTPRWIYETGTYYDSIASHDVFSQAPDDIRCDSILSVKAFKLKRDTVRWTEHILNTEVREFYGRDLQMSGIYYAEDTVSLDPTGTDVTMRRCNNIMELTLIVDTVYVFRDSIHLCLPVDSFYYHQWPGGHWQGDDGFLGPDGEKKKLKIEHSGTYTDSLRREVTRLSTDAYYKNFKDSIYQLVVTMDTAYVTKQIYDLCEGDSIQFNEQWIYTEGVYRDTLTTINGCDSIIQLVVNKIPSYRITLPSVRISDKMLPYVWETTDSHHGGTVHELYNSGLYIDTLKTVRGCDSIVSLLLEVAPSYWIEDSIHVCSTFNGEEHTYHFADGHEMKFNYSGDYYDSLRTVNAHPTWQSDSIYHLYVTTHFSERTRKDTIICRDDSVMFNGQYITTEGIYYDTIPTMPRDSRDTCHCDSIIEWNIIFAEHYFVNEGEVRIPTGGQYLWHWHGGDTLLTTTGVYYDRNESQYGCDSTYSLTLTVCPTYHFQERIEVCSDELPYQWRNQMLLKSGQYWDSLHTTLQFDSIYELNFIVHDTVHVYTTYQGCKGDSVFFNGKWLTMAGQYTDTLKTTFGCDSIVHFNYQWNSSYYHKETAQTDDQHPYVWTGHTNDAGETYVFTHSGVYYDYLKTEQGCDSTIELTLTVGTTYLFRDSMTVCQSLLPIDWHGRKLIDEGYYFDSLQTVLGYDSVYQMHLMILPTYTANENVTICQGETFTYYGKTYTTAGQYKDTLTASNGCDSVITINLRYLPTYTIQREHTMSDKETYEFYGRTLTQSGTYRYEGKTEAGCDSIIELKLNVGHTYMFRDSMTVCQSELPVLWHGRQLIDEQYYFDTLQTVLGYDSVFRFHLMILPTYTADLKVTLCEGEPFTYNHKHYTQAGQYKDTLKATNGCDSIITIDLRYIPTYYIQHEHTMSDQETYHFFGRTLTQSGIYKYEGKTEEGCDSIVELKLTVGHTYMFRDSMTVCQSELPIKWHERLLIDENYYYDTLQTVLGYDSIYRFHLMILPTYTAHHDVTLCEGEPFTYNSKTYTKAGHYKDTLTAKNGCDSIVTINIRYAPKEYIVRYDTISDQETYAFDGRELNQPGTYFLHGKTKEDCDSIVELHLYVAPTYHFYDSVAICQSELPYEWQGEKKYDKDSTYIKRFSTTLGYDSVYVLRLHVLDVYHEDKVYTMCNGETFEYKGVTYSEGTVIHDTLRAMNGCDSIVSITLKYRPVQYREDSRTISDKETLSYRGEQLTHSGDYIFTDRYVGTDCDSMITTLHLTVAPTYYFYDSVAVCRESLPYEWQGEKKYSKDSTYIKRYATSLGYDSIYVLRLHVLETSYSTVNGIVCEGDSLFVGGAWQHTGGRYIDTLTSMLNGCDSIRTTILTLIPVIHTERTVLLCEGDVYTDMFGEAHPDYTGGNYYDTLSSVITGCDSIITTHLVYRPVRKNEYSRTICDKETYQFFDTLLNTAGTYVHYEKYVGTICDSMVTTLHLTIAPTYHFYDSVAVCQNDLPYEWQGEKKYSKDSTYFKRYSTTLGYDSIYELRLHVLPVEHTEQTISICEGEKRFLGGAWRTEGGRYTDTLTSKVTGCDSIVTTRLHIIPVKRTERTITLCQGESYRMFNGTIVTTGGNYSDTLTSKVDGCDSIVITHLSFTPTYYVKKTRIAEEGQTLVLQEKDETINVTTDGVYLFTFKVEGTECDSIVEYTVTYKHTYDIRITDDICYEDLPYVWNGKQYYQSGTYTYNFKSIYGMDSIVTLSLTVHEQVPMTSVQVSLCYGDTFRVNNDKVFREAGIYYDTVYSALGCDSVTQYVVNYYPNFNIFLKDTICHGDTIVFGGRKITEEGTYIYRGETMQGCDSIVHLELVVFPSYIFESHDLITEDQLPYPHGGELYYEPGVYEKIYASIHGCDSIYRYTLTVTDKVSDWDTLYLCSKQDTLFLRGDTITKPGQYQYERRSASGKIDSLYRVDVVYGHITKQTINATICEGEYYSVGRYRFSATTKDTIRLENTEGCDSIIYLNLTVNPTYTHTDRATVFDFDCPYIWEHKRYYNTGTYTDTLMTTHGCDSVLILHLTVVETKRDTTKAEICDGDIYHWRGKDYTYTGVYIDSICQLTSLRSEIYILDLKVVQPINVTYVEEFVDNICADEDKQFTINMLYAGSRPTTYNVYFDQAGHYAGFTDMIDAPYNGAITVDLPDLSDRNTYVTPGIYNAIILLDNGACDNSTMKVKFLIRYPSWILEQNWMNTVSVLNNQNNGGFEFVGYEWFVDGRHINGAMNAYLYDQTLRPGNVVYARLTRRGEQTAIETCPIVIANNAGLDQTPIFTVQANSEVRRITVKAEENIQYRIFSHSGHLIETGSLLKDSEKQVEAAEASGCYFVWGISEEGNSKTEKVIIY